MRWDARATMALVVSALVGVTAGVVVGFTTGNPDPSQAGMHDPTSSPTASSPGSADDPLHLGIPLVDLPCTGQHILVVGAGDTSGGLVNAVASNRDAGAKYLDVTDSCKTLYGDEKGPKPAYAVYLGPFATIYEPCSLQMSIDHPRDVVTTLDHGVKIHVQCLCAMEKKDLPDLRVGMLADTRVGIYVRALQRLLVDLGMHVPVSGVYEHQTAAAIKKLQQINAIDPRLYGQVEAQTWQLVRDRACVNYDF